MGNYGDDERDRRVHGNDDENFNDRNTVVDRPRKGNDDSSGGNDSRRETTARLGKERRWGGGRAFRVFRYLFVVASFDVVVHDQRFRPKQTTQDRVSASS